MNDIDYYNLVQDLDYLYYDPWFEYDDDDDLYDEDLLDDFDF